MTKKHHARLALAVRSPEQAQLCVDHLQSLGFRILSSSKRGVDFEGSEEAFESTFQVPILSMNGSIRFTKDPVLDGILVGYDVESVYFPTKPSYF